MKGKCIQLMVNGAVGFFPKEFVEKAVEKQIPKAARSETIYHGINISGEYQIETPCYCPVCDRYVGDYEKQWLEKYCPDCGQALFWGVMQNE